MSGTTTGGEMGEKGVYEGNSKSGYIKAMPLEDYEAMRREIAALREIVRALTEAPDAGMYTIGGIQQCAYCGYSIGDVFQIPHDGHKLDCPILAGRARLAKGANGGA